MRFGNLLWRLLLKKQGHKIGVKVWVVGEGGVLAVTKKK